LAKRRTVPIAFDYRRTLAATQVRRKRISKGLQCRPTPVFLRHTERAFNLIHPARDSKINLYSDTGTDTTEAEFREKWKDHAR
jgi:hypothetical protein